MKVCQECNVRLESMDSYMAHINGKRHKKNMKILEEENFKFKHQAYISWEKGVNNNDVESFVSTFGLVKSLFVNNDQKYAIVDFEQSDSCSKFLSNDKYKLQNGLEIVVNTRLKSKKRPASSLNDSPRSMTNSSNSPSKPSKKARMYEDPPSKQKEMNQGHGSHAEPSADCTRDSVEVREGTSETGHVEEVIEVGMRNMWKSVDCHERKAPKRSIAVDDADLAPCPSIPINKRRLPTMAINNKNVLRSDMNRQVTCPLPKKDDNEKKDKTEIEVNKGLMKAIIKELMQSKSVDNQMIRLVERIQLQKSDVDSRHKLAEQLRTIARNVPDLNDCKVYIFGSSANGMGVKGCDLDLILNVNSEMDTTKAMKSMRKRLHSCYRPAFKDIVLIPSKRCPIIKFHCPSLDLKCDLSFNNRLAIRNTEVLRHLSFNTPQFRILCFVLRKWTDSVGVGGNICGGPNLTHYALYMLIWYFIRSKYNLLSFEEMSHLCDKTYIDQWDCTFPFDQPQLVQVKEHVLQELLIDFFDFYSDLNFQDNVMSVRDGKMIPFDEMQKFEPFKKTDIMVQDPFLLEHNITQNVTNLILGRFKNACKEASSICTSTTFGMRPNDQNVPWGLILLLNQKPPEDISNLKTGRPQKGRILNFNLNKTLGGPKCLLGTKGLNKNVHEYKSNATEPYKIPSESISLEVKFVPILVNEIVSAVERVLRGVYLVKIDSIGCRPYTKEDSCLKDGDLPPVNNSQDDIILNDDGTSSSYTQGDSLAENVDKSKSKIDSKLLQPNHYKNATELSECMLQFDCITTLKTWIGRNKYKQYVRNALDALEKEKLMTLKMLELKQQKSGQKSDIVEEMEGCHMPFVMNIEVRKIDVNDTLVVFHVVPHKSNPKDLALEFNHFTNSFINVVKYAMKSL